MPVAPTAVTAPPPVVLRHTPAEDVLGLLTGTVVASLGLFLLKSSGAATGGTAGIALLTTYATALPFGPVFFAVNVPFFLLALRVKGLDFALRTLLAITLVSAMAFVHPAAFGRAQVNPVFGVLCGNLLAGVGMLILFRHRASLGGLSIVALIVQDRWGWRAGYVQMAFDVTIIVASFALLPPTTVALSAAGAVLLNIVLALNHRPGRYLAG